MIDDMVEHLARVIDPSSWAVMDGYLEETKRKYKGQHVGWPADQFKHKESMAKARAVIAAMRDPTPAMIDRFVSRALCVSIHSEGGWSNYARSQWQAMVDGALSEDEQ